MLTKRSLFIGFMILFSSCEDESIEDDNSIRYESQQKVILFKGLMVNHRFSTPLKVLDNSQDFLNLSKMYDGFNLRSSKAKQTDKNDLIDSSTLSPEIILEGAKNVVDLFPYQDLDVDSDVDILLKEQFEQQKLPPEVRRKWRDEGFLVDIENIILEKERNEQETFEKKAEENFDMIKSDFSELSNKEIAENIDVIEEYYSKNFDYEVLKNISQNQSEIIQNLRRSEGNLASRSLKSGDSEGFYKRACVIAKAKLAGYGSTLDLVAMAIASKEAQDSSTSRFDAKEGGGQNDRQDAYRHILWSALLAQYSPSVSSKKKPLKFSEFIGNENENCGDDNPIDSKEMDLHNNRIGREIWNRLTRYRKSFGFTVGLRRASLSEIKSEVFDYVQQKSCMIVKFPGDKRPNSLIKNQVDNIIIVDRIRETDKSTAVYFDGTIAPNYLTSPQGPIDYLLNDKPNDYNFEDCKNSNLTPPYYSILNIGYFNPFYNRYIPGFIMYSFPPCAKITKSACFVLPN